MQINISSDRHYIMIVVVVISPPLVPLVWSDVQLAVCLYKTHMCILSMRGMDVEYYFAEMEPPSRHTSKR